MIETTQGIFDKKTKKWYYLNLGPNHISRDLTKLRNALNAREIGYSIVDGRINYFDSEVITYALAKERDAEIIAIHANKHIEALAKAQAEEESMDLLDLYEE
jgi:hypothetical protein